MARELDEDELIGNWTLIGDELEQLSGRRGTTKLGFALLLRFYAVHGRFPSGRSEIPDQAIAHVARLVDVPASDLGFYEWDGRTVKAHRADIRRYFGFRECSAADADKAAEWLAANVCEKERQADRVRDELLAHLKREQVEPPARDRIRRIVGTALRQAEQALTTRIAGQVPAEAVARMRALIARAADPGDEGGAGPGDDGALFDAAEIAEITAVVTLVSANPGPDLLVALRLAWYRDQLADRNTHIPAQLPALWATLGQPVRAEALARSMTSPIDQTEALSSVASAAAGAGDYDRAEQIVQAITDPFDQARALTAVASAAGGAGDYDRAERIARSITDSDWQAQALADVARAAARAGDRARELAADAERIARSITDPDDQARALANVASAAAGAADYDRAERIARSITDSDWQARALADVASAAARAGDRDRARELAADAERIARSITNPYYQAQTLSIMATAPALTGDYDRAERIARSITNPYYQVRALADAASAAAAAGDRDRARELFADAERIARSITNPDDQEQTLTDVASAAARAGDYDRAERIAQSISNPNWQAPAMAAMATVAAGTGDYGRAERIARSITNLPWQMGALTGVASAAAQAGDYDHAERIARSITNPDDQARALADVAIRVAEPVRARSCIAGALAAARWTIPLDALAVVDPAALSIFAGELTAFSGRAGTAGNGLLSGTPTRRGIG